MYAAVLTDYNHIEWKEVPDPVLVSETGVVVRVGYAGICGSDLHVFRGEFHPRTSLPLIQGHEFAGTVVETGPAVSRFRPGDRVVVDPIIWCGDCPACRLQHYPACSRLRLTGVDEPGGFAEYVVVEEFQLHRLPDNLADREAALVEVFAIGFHACRRAELGPGQSVVIWGAGRVGQCILQAARTISKGPFFIVDTCVQRLALVREHFPGVRCIDPRQEDPFAVMREGTGGAGVAVAFEAVGHAEALEGLPPPVACCAQAIHGAGTICVLGLGDQAVPLVFKELIWKEARLITSRVTHGEFPQAVGQLAAGALQPVALVSAEFPGERTAEAFQLLQAEPEKYLKILLRFGQ